MFLVAILALVFIGPKELPATMRTVGRWVGRVRAQARHFTSGIENMMREAELEEMEKKWREENERIMRDHPPVLPYAGAEPGYNSTHPFVPSEVEARGSSSSTEQRSSTSLGTNGDGSDDPQLPLPAPDTSHRPLP